MPQPGKLSEFYFPRHKCVDIIRRLTNLSIMKWLPLLLFSIISCTNGDRQVALTPTHNDSTTRIKPKKEFRFASVSLFSIEPTFYHQADTIVDFPDGKHAYENFFGGSGFIDSSGRPIHDRYRKYNLSSEQMDTLRSKFLTKLCFGYRKMCTTTYRDVLIFYDSSQKVLAQAPICFSCNEVSIYPKMDEICDEPNLDFNDLKKFISNIKAK